MRTYYVCLENEAGARMVHHVLAIWYDRAQEQAVVWADNHPDHAKHGPWHATYSDVSA